MALTDWCSQATDQTTSRKVKRSTSQICSAVRQQSMEKLKSCDDYAAWAFGKRMVMIKEASCEFPGRRVDRRAVVGPCLGDNLPQYLEV